MSITLDYDTNLGVDIVAKDWSKVMDFVELV